MSINKPYYRIARPFLNNGWVSNVENCYILDSNYASDRSSLIRSYLLIENDLKEIFKYIDPNDTNLDTFSIKNYELLLRACTEFETNAKLILFANKYPRSIIPNPKLCINDYFRINAIAKLNEYKVHLNFWTPNNKTLSPFSNWNTITYNSLTWYKAYNNVKHHRSTYFHEANLENVINAVAGVFIILYAQFNIFTFDPYQITSFTLGSNGIESVPNSLFAIEAPNTWLHTEKYDFDWNTIKTIPNSIQLYTF